MAQPSGRPVDAGELLALLWQPDSPSRRGPERSRSLSDVVRAATRIADQAGLAAVTMRAVAQAVGVSPMSLYGYVPGKDALVALMIDQVYDQMAKPSFGARPAADRLRQVADLNRQLFLTHPWLADRSSARPPLGPGVMAKYEYELTGFAGLGLDDVTTDDCLTYLLTYVHGAARARLAVLETQRETGTTDQEWWDRYQPLFARVFDARRYPTAARVGAAAGAARGTAYDPDQSYTFGLDRTIEAILSLASPPDLSA